MECVFYNRETNERIGTSVEDGQDLAPGETKVFPRALTGEEIAERKAEAQRNLEILRGEKDTEAYKGFLERVKEINAGKEVYGNPKYRMTITEEYKMHLGNLCLRRFLIREAQMFYARFSRPLTFGQ